MKDTDTKNFIIYISSSIHIARIFQSKSTTLHLHSERTYKILEELFKEFQYIELSISEDHLFLNNERIRVGIDIMGIYRALIHDLESLSIGSIIFTKMPSIDEVTSFLYVLGWGLSNVSSSFYEISDYLEEMKVQSIQIKMLEDSQTKEGMVRSVRKEAIRNLLDSINYLRIATQEGKGDIYEARRLVRKFTDLVVEDRDYLIALTAIKDIGSYTFNHSVNVCILSIAMGMELGLSRRDLLDLGIAALFHDLGKIDIPGDIVNKPDTLSDLEYDEIKQHPYLSAERILFLKGMDELPVFALEGVLEHHIDYSGKGYPDLNKKEPGLFARIIRLVDSYDAMTSPRIYHSIKTPLDALKYIVEDDKDTYDPSLVKIFLDIMGIYPPGTIVSLKGGMKGVLISENQVAVVGKDRSLENIEEEVVIERALSPDEVDFDPGSIIAALGSSEDTASL